MIRAALIAVSVVTLQVGVLSAGYAQGWAQVEDATIHEVVVNQEEQYSIWPVDRGIPLGWSMVGFRGTKQQCMDYIREVTSGMGPGS